MLPRKKRIELLSDKNTHLKNGLSDIESIDTLGFTGKQSYIEKLDANQKKSGYSDAVTVGGCTLGGFNWFRRYGFFFSRCKYGKCCWRKNYLYD